MLTELALCRHVGDMMGEILFKMTIITVTKKLTELRNPRSQYDTTQPSFQNPELVNG